MRFFLLILICFAFFSCSYFDKKKLDSSDLLQEELEVFIWDQVDKYPTFAACDYAVDFQEAKACFESTLTDHVSQYLASRDINVSKMLNDTISMYFTLDNSGVLQIDSILSAVKTRKQIPEMDSLLSQSIEGLPKIFPAIKRGQYVQTAFQIPIIIVSDNE